MVEYGFINEGGYLVSKVLEQFIQRIDNEGVIQEKLISIEMQIPELIDEGWKPIDIVDESQLEAKNRYSSIRIKPFDNGDRISYEYIEFFNKKLIEEEIEKLKSELEDSDYKITKSYEASLIGESIPYDIKELRNIREGFRTKINEFEQLLK